MAYNMKRGNSAVPFKELGSSPAKQLKKKGVKEGATEAMSQISQNLIKGKKMLNTLYSGKLLKSLKQGFAEGVSERLTRTIINKMKTKPPYKKPVGPRAR